MMYSNLAGPPLAVRQELFDFIVEELKARERKQHPAIRKLRKALHNQRDQLLGFAGVLDQKLTQIAQQFEVPLQQVRAVCLLHRKQPTSDAYWQRWNQLHSEISREVSLADGSGWTSPQTDTESQFLGGESQLQATQLFFPASEFGRALLGPAPVFPQPSLLRAQCKT